MTAKQPRPKKCRICREPFTPRKALQIVCGPSCALLHTKQKGEKERKAIAKVERKAIKVRKEQLKGRAEYMKEAQQAFNAWVRERDYGQPCISCGTTANVQYAAGHYRTTQACPELRFEPLNVHVQCNRNCNMGKSGNLIEYRIGLIARIGAEKVAWLEGRHEAKRYTIDDLKEIKTKYRAMARRLRLAQVKP